MTTRIRRRLSTWGLVLIALGALVAVFVFISLNKPLPTYLVAKRDIAAGETLVMADFDNIALDLGPLSGRYLGSVSDQTQALSQIPMGELIPISRVGRELFENQTSVRVIPSTKPSSSVQAGSWVSVWQVVEEEEEFEPQLLVERAQVSAVQYGEGLFADELPEVEILLGSEQAMLLITALAADFDVYVLPLP